MSPAPQPESALPGKDLRCAIGGTSPQGAMRQLDPALQMGVNFPRLLGRAEGGRDLAGEPVASWMLRQQN
jgi:hypothetical protein